MHLRFRRTGTDRTPRNQIRNVLRANHVEVLGAGRQTKFVDPQQQFARSAQPFVDLEAVVHVRVVDQTLPADRRARFFEIHAHHYFKLASETLALLDEPARVFQGGSCVVDRARSYDHDQAILHAMQNAVHRLAGVVDEVRYRFRAREFTDQVSGRRQFFQFANPDIVGVVRGHGWFSRNSYLVLRKFLIHDAKTLRREYIGQKKTARQSWRFFGKLGFYKTTHPSRSASGLRYQKK